MPHCILNNFFPTYLNIEEIVGAKQSKQIVQLIETNYFRSESSLQLKTFTANQYFEYCKIAYNAVKKNLDENIKNDGKKLYKLFADGRHEGLLDIKTNSKAEFESWLDNTHPKKTVGGHPWEILSGGNTTHVSLRVYRPSYSKTGFYIRLESDAFTRLKEVVAIALALHKAGLPFLLFGADKLRLRLLAQDTIGVVPENESLHRANQSFDNEDVTDVLHLYSIKKKIKLIEPFITWEPLPILKPIG